MKEVTFPFLNLKLNVNPIMFSVFGINIYWYAFLIVSSIVIGIIMGKKITEDMGYVLMIF